MPAPRTTRAQPKPKVAGHRRRRDARSPEAETDRPTGVTSGAPGEAGAPTGGEGAGAGTSSMRLVRYLAAAFIVLSALAIWFAVAAHGATSDNTALIDSRATGDVTSQVRETIEKTFSYDHTKPGETENRARQRLAGEATQQYHQLFDTVTRLAPQQNITLTTKVQDIGVLALQDDQARLLVFAGQNATRQGTDQHSAGAAQLEVDARRSGSDWKITRITVL